MWLLTISLSALLVGSVLPMETFWGRCPARPEAVPDFDMERFEGLWYLVETFDPSERCLTWNISKGDASKEWIVVESKESGAISAIGLSHETFNTGIITQPDENNPGHLRIYWPISGIAGDAALTVNSVDYDHYAGLFECQNVIAFHRQNGIVLSRSPVPKIEHRQNARVRGEGIKTEYYMRVLQGNCKYRFKKEEEEESEPEQEDIFNHGGFGQFRG